MYLTAQRVVAPSGATGINAYCYAGGEASPSASATALLDAAPGELVAERVEVAPAGNRVRSYLDVVLPAEASAGAFGEAFQAFLAASAAQPLPWIGRHGPFAFRLAMDEGLAASWHSEVAALLRAIAKVGEIAAEQSAKGGPG